MIARPGPSIHSAASTTQAAISGMAGNKDARTGDKETGIAQIFDAGTVQKEIDAQVQITQLFSTQAPKVVASYADKQQSMLRAQASTETDPSRKAALLADAQHWEEGGAYRVALHTATAGLAGGVAGAAGAGTVAAAAPLMNELQSSITKQLTKAGVNPTVAKGAAQAVALTTAAALGAVAGGGTVAGAAAGWNVDANNRMLHHNEKEMIAKKANGDNVAVERLTKAACFEIKCWAQFPEGSPLYIQSYVSPAEAAGLKQEIAWVNQQKINGDFIYTPFQKFTDGVAVTTGLSSVNGLGTLNGQFISKPSQPFRSNDCVTAECAAGMAPFRGNKPPDYLSAQVNFYTFSAGGAINLHNGDIFGQWGLGRQYPIYTAQPGVSFTAGTIRESNTASDTSAFLKGGGGQAVYFSPLVPATPWIGFGGGVNHSYGGKTSVEYGVSIPPGGGVNPVNYGFEKNKQEVKK